MGKFWKDVGSICWAWNVVWYFSSLLYIRYASELSITGGEVRKSWIKSFRIISSPKFYSFVFHLFWSQNPLSKFNWHTMLPNGGTPSKTFFTKTHFYFSSLYLNSAWILKATLYYLYSFVIPNIHNTIRYFASKNIR